MKGYMVPLSCPRCGGAVRHVNASKTDVGSACSAIAECSDCSREWQVTVLLRPVPKPYTLRKQLYREKAKAAQ